MYHHSKHPFRLFLAAACAAGAAFCGTSQAATAPLSSGNGTTLTFNFEDQAVSDPSSLTTLTLGSGGLVTLSAGDPQAFGFQDLSQLGIPGAESFGTRSIQPDLYDQPVPFTINFSQAVTSVSLDFADASDQADQLSLNAFSSADGGGTMVNSQSATLNSSLDQFAVKTLTVTGTDIRSVQFAGGPAGMDTAFFDNLSVTTSGPVTSAVPLPDAAKLFAVGAVVAALAARKLRPKTAA